MSLYESLGLLIATLCFAAALVFAYLTVVEHWLYRAELRQSAQDQNTYAWNHHKWLTEYACAAALVALIGLMLISINQRAFEQFVSSLT